MTNRPKQIGTAAETAVVRAAHPRGFPNADRLTLTGALDRGDVGLCPGVMIEVKGGDAARSASDGMIEGWLVETERERDNAHADVALLVTQRAGVGPTNAHRWWAWFRHGWVTHLTGGALHPLLDDIPVRMQLGDALVLLRHAGYGNPLDTGQENERPNVPADVPVRGVA